MLRHTMVLKQQLLTVIAASNAGNCAASQAVHATSDASGFCTYAHAHTRTPLGATTCCGCVQGCAHLHVQQLCAQLGSPVHCAAQMMVGASQPAGWQPGPGGLPQHSAWLLAQQLPAQLPSPQTLPAAHE